jgi:hypothetical protein
MLENSNGIIFEVIKATNNTFVSVSLIYDETVIHNATGFIKQFCDGSA